MSRFAPLFVLLVTIAGCSSQRLEWREFDTPALPFEEVWTTLVAKASMNGFGPKSTGEEPTDRGLRVFHSKWVTREYGFRNTSRKRMHAEFQPSETTTGGWRIKLRIERQQVFDMAKSMNPEDRDWKSDGQDVDAENRIMAQVKMQLGMVAIQPRERGK